MICVISLVEKRVKSVAVNWKNFASLAGEVRELYLCRNPNRTHGYGSRIFSSDWPKWCNRLVTR